MKEKVYFSIDLKSFFASCECVKEKKDPYKEPIVIANPHQGNGAITLAVTPFLKKQGVKSRCRLYEIPKHINYKIKEPNMKLYHEYSKKVVDVYLSFIDKSDLHIYSIDECFLDVTSYLKYYNKSEIELAKDILDKVKKETGLTATCGIGNSIFLAKVAMDIEAKNNDTFIAYWKSIEIHNNLWKLSNLQKVWGIGPSLCKKLNNLGIFTGKDLANSDKIFLKSNLGIIGENLWNNFNGLYTETIKNLNESPKEKSISHSNFLLRDYEANEILPIILKMCEKLEMRLQCEKKLFSTLNFKLIYSNNIQATNKTVSVSPTNSLKIMYISIESIINDNIFSMPIRRIDINLSKLVDKKNIQLSLFDKQDEDTLSNVMLSIKDKYGYNSITRATNIENK